VQLIHTVASRLLTAGRGSRSTRWQRWHSSGTPLRIKRKKKRSISLPEREQEKRPSWLDSYTAASERFWTGSLFLFSILPTGAVVIEAAPHRRSNRWPSPSWIVSLRFHCDWQDRQPHRWSLLYCRQLWGRNWHESQGNLQDLGNPQQQQHKDLIEKNKTKTKTRWKRYQPERARLSALSSSSLDVDTDLSTNRL